MSATHHAMAYFTGHVQGLGFRYQTLQVAQEFEVAGCVSNLPDGRVLVEVEGAGPEVRDFFAAVQERMEGYIRKMELSEGSRPAQFKGFVIR